MNMNDAFVGSLIFNKNGGSGGASALDDLTDVTLTTPSNNDVLKYDSATSKWVNGTGGGGGASALDDLTDVDVTTPSNGDTLIYDSANSKWINGTGSSGSAKQTALTQAEYDALVQAGTVDPTMEYFITDGIPATIKYGHNYSTTEHEIGTWIDGSTMYETTIVINSLVRDGTDQMVNHGISGINLILGYEGFFSKSSDGRCTDKNLDPTGQYDCTIFEANRTQVGYAINAGWDYDKAYVTLRYNKSSS